MICEIWFIYFCQNLSDIQLTWLDLIVIRDIISEILHWALKRKHEKHKILFTFFGRIECVHTLNMGESHTPSTPISLRCSNLEVIPFKSPIPSPSLSLNDLIKQTLLKILHFSISLLCGNFQKTSIPRINLIEIPTSIPIIWIY